MTKKKVPRWPFIAGWLVLWSVLFVTVIYLYDVYSFAYFVMIVGAFAVPKIATRYFLELE